ncbi:uncharacterized protein N7506_001494 [Penicillium brevicompactum]|uniref:uncharacterized protein n=1 Tax=Penicillium brevicompactum TaxID=5074 RepID=UPI0025409C9C|nr:uncharacterized protein N7506_001494 [Penicillium brevicompactum]KAJ5348241.1 hypothetical protein N7506_001494 [Penicillium brevicompactum]
MAVVVFMSEKERHEMRTVEWSLNDLQGNAFDRGGSSSEESQRGQSEKLGKVLARWPQPRSALPVLPSAWLDLSGSLLGCPCFQV